MYSEKITQKQIELLEQDVKVKLQRHSVEKVQEWSEHLEQLVTKVDQKTGEVLGWKRPLRPEEKEFARNEFLLSKVDFRYYAPRYSALLRDQVDGGGRGKLNFWASQTKLLDILGGIEERNWDAFERGETVPGIRVALNKARQLGATAMSRALLMHRLALWTDHRAMSASVDEDKVMELYDRDKFILSSLPWYLRPSIGYDTKGSHIYFDKLNSRVLYQQSQQQTGLGQGRQFELAHITECASFENATVQIEHDFFPTLPDGPQTLCILESTPQGMGGWWQEFTENIRMGDYGYDWTYIFIPWYVEVKKYRKTPPPWWNPSELTVLHQKKVHATSKDVLGYQVDLTKEQMFWYEQKRKQYQKGGNLNVFLTNYCATHEESFQHIERSALPTEVIEKLRLSISDGYPYEVTTT